MPRFKMLAIDFAGTLAVLEPRTEALIFDYLSEKFSVKVDVRLSNSLSKIEADFPYSSLENSSLKSRRSHYIEFNKRVFADMGIAADSAGLFEFIESSKRSWILRNHALDLLQFLHVRGIPVAILSNFDIRLRTMLTKLGVSQFIRNSYISQEIGLEKPDVRFYQHFLTSENVQPGEVLYVGDSPELDWVPARKVGLTCLIISEFLTPQFGTKLKPFLIENLNEVKGYFPDNSKI